MQTPLGVTSTLRPTANVESRIRAQSKKRGERRFSFSHQTVTTGCQAWESSAKQRKDANKQETSQDAHLLVFMHLCEIHTAAERSTRREAAKEIRGVEKNVGRRDKHVSPGIFQIRWLLRRRPPRWSRVEVFWTFRALLVHSHGPWQGNSGWKQGWSGAWKGWDDSSATISDERILHTMQDHLQQTTVITKRRPQKMLSKQSTSKTKDDAASEAMEALTQEREQQEEARCVCEQKCDEASVAQTMFNDTFKVTLEKAEALERHVKKVTMGAESLATTDGDFFYTLVNRQEEGQKYLNSLSAQLSTVAPAAHHHEPPEAAQHLRPHHTAESRDVFQVLQQRKGAGGAAVGGHCCPTCAFPKFGSALDCTSMERCQQLRTILRAALLFDEARARSDWEGRGKRCLYLIIG